MKSWHYGLLVLLSLGIVLVSFAYQGAPGYMDAQYYYSGALRLYQGKGFTEEILWNFLDNPDGLPHSSHGYWMPLVSILGAAGMKLAGSPEFAYSRIILAILAVSVAPATAAFAFQLTRRKDLALLSGLLAIFSGFYLPMITLTDSFAVLMVLGLVYFSILRAFQAPLSKAGALSRALILGLAAGLMHLSRSDGLLWLFVASCYILFSRVEAFGQLTWKGRLAILSFCFVGYGLVMAPWFYRNFGLYGSFLPPGNIRTLWLTQFEDLYIYPASLLTPARWIESGIGEILRARSWALGWNLQTILGVQCQIVLAPFLLLGFWRLRSQLFMRAALFSYGVIFAVMTLIFPYAGARGGFMHSGAALQPIIWIVAPAGLDAALEWMARVRNWKLKEARRVFQAYLVGIVALTTAGIFMTRVTGFPGDQPAWGEMELRYQQIEQALIQYGAEDTDRVLVNNAPGYFSVTQRQAISIPFGEIETVLAVARRYQVSYLIVEEDQVVGASWLFTQPGDYPGLDYIADAAEARIYAFGLP